MSDDDKGGEWVNSVELVGRVSGEPEERVLPSGDVVWTFRVVVPREATRSSRATVDTLDCAAWTGRAQRSARAWHTGDVVRVTGRIRRRFFAGGGGRGQSRVEVEMASGSVIRRRQSA